MGLKSRPRTGPVCVEFLRMYASFVLQRWRGLDGIRRVSQGDHSLDVLLEQLGGIEDVQLTVFETGRDDAARARVVDVTPRDTVEPVRPSSDVLPWLSIENAPCTDRHGRLGPGLTLSAELILVAVEEVGRPDLERARIREGLVERARDGARREQGRRLGRPRERRRPMDFFQLHAWRWRREGEDNLGSDHVAWWQSLHPRLPRHGHHEVAV
jgi:hypothetical protein